MSAVKSRISYTVFGTGTSPCVLAFHGFGQSASIFEPLASLYEEGCIIAFNTHISPYTIDHSPIFFAQEVARILAAEGITDSVSLLTFSLGSYPALALLAHLPHPITHVLMLAPEALAPHWMFCWATRNSVGRYLFWQMTQGKLRQPIMSVAAMLSKLGISRSLMVLLRRSLSTPTRASLLWQTWHAYSQYRLNPAKILQEVHQKGIEIRLIFGKEDGIVPIKRFSSLKKKCSFIQMEVLPYNHFDMLHNWMGRFL